MSPINTASYWIESTSSPKFSSPKEDLAVDVVVVGAGMTGVTTAYLLKRAGLYQPRVGAHNFRRSIGRQGLKLTGNLHLVSSALRHEAQGVTALYAEQTQQERDQLLADVYRSFRGTAPSGAARDPAGLAAAPGGA
jgi:threonine dehydrogenase-like Zn-dependent dehydrogenase